MRNPFARGSLPALLVLPLFTAVACAQNLDDELQRIPVTELVQQTREAGDAARGAVVFFQHHMACAKCHVAGAPAALGPDLTALAKTVSDEQLIEAVLKPSKEIRKGFEPVTVVLADGRTLVGLLIERSDDRVVMRDAARNGEIVTLTAAEIDEVVPGTVSIMPSGQMNQLASRQQFLDLIRYLIEIRDGGAARAKELQPPPALLTFTLPEYEQHIDHAGFIRDWDDEAFQRGEAIYRRVCQNCHGTKDQPGSLPTSLKFAEGKFRSGSDPHTMYQTLTKGFGLMAPQTWMVPSQKYDVIHYIRETYLKPHNPSQLVAINDAYLARLPQGNTRGPEPSTIEAWSAMDYGPSLTHTYEVPGERLNIAYKGIAIRLDPGAGGVSRGRHWMLFDTDTLRMAAAWSAPDDAKTETSSFIDWRGVQFNGEHNIHPTIVGDVMLSNAIGPGWADPDTGSFEDEHRVVGRDDRRYGPLPRDWARFRGVILHGQQVVLRYSVGNTLLLESPSVLPSDGSTLSPAMVRTFNIAPRERELTLQVTEHPAAATAIARHSREGGNPDVAPRLSREDGNPATHNSSHLVLQSGDDEPLHIGFAPSTLPLKWSAAGDALRLTIPAGEEVLRFSIWSATGDDSAGAPPLVDAERDLNPLSNGGPLRWPQMLTTTAVLGPDNGPLAADMLTPPETNPWLAQTRLTGLDFFSDGRLAVCSWDGDVWIVTPHDGSPQLTWQRIASGLFQPLGLRVIHDQIHLTCRDQLVALHDLNGDGEIDDYECLNNDHQVTEHFHEFAMGLQTDEDGNFYYAKSARHALKAIVPHHGTLLRITPDGSRTDILANGFRAANGVCLNPDGSFFVTDQEGHWNPKNRINRVTLSDDGRPKFYGNMFGYHDVTDSSDSAMEPPLCWITNAFDRSPGELLWVDSRKWGPLNGRLLNLSYGYGKVFLVPHEEVDLPGRGDVQQGGMIELPIASFPTGVMRGRFNAHDGHLYLCGMFAWAGSAVHPGGLYRLRATGQPWHLPLELHAKSGRLELTFAEPLDAASVTRDRIAIKTWSLKRTKNYGSEHHDERPLEIRNASLSADGHTVVIEADVQPTWCMEIRYDLLSAEGKPVAGTIHNTIHGVASP